MTKSERGSTKECRQRERERERAMDEEVELEHDMDGLNKFMTPEMDRR